MSTQKREHRVAPFELFFDLVFVFAFTQVTAVWVALHSYELVWWRAARAQVQIHVESR